MNYLKQLIDLRDLTCQDIATATGFGYHSIQKNIKGARRNTSIRNAIAGFLDLDPARTWGKGSVIYLRRLVAIEANQVAQEKAEVTRTEFLKRYSDSATLPAKRKVVNV
jgi:hypothetical protein